MAVVGHTSFSGECEVFIIISRGHRLKMVMKHCISFCSYSIFCDSIMMKISQEASVE